MALKREHKELAIRIASGMYYAKAYFATYPNYNGKKKDAACEVSKIKKRHHPEFMDFVEKERDRLLSQFMDDNAKATKMLLDELLKIINSEHTGARDKINAIERFSRILGLDKPTSIKIDQEVKHTHLLDMIESSPALPSSIIDVTPKKIE